MIYDLVVPQFTKMLGNLLSILDEAEKYAAEKKFDVGVLLQSRLAPDQFNLMRQVQVACDTAKLGAARLTDSEKDAPAHADTEQTLTEVKARIESVVAYLNGFSPGDFAAAAEQRISQPRWKGKTLSGHEFLIPRPLASPLRGSPVGPVSPPWQATPSRLDYPGSRLLN